MKVLVIGASLKEERYSNKAIKMLNLFEHEVLAIGLRNGIVNETSIVTNKENFDSVDTITLYLNASRQSEFYNYIIQLKPRRVIFNPGTENPELYNRLDSANIAHEESCTLVLLQSGLF
jgi:predicted CoA-binding protein